MNRLNHENASDEEPRIIRVDFRKRKVIEVVPASYADAPVIPDNGDPQALVVEERSDIQDVLEQSDVLFVLGRFGNFLKSIRGNLRGGTFKQTMIDHRRDSVGELCSLLTNGEGHWARHPQYYNAISTLLIEKFGASLDQV